MIDFGMMKGLLAKPFLTEGRGRLRSNRGTKSLKVKSQQEINKPADRCATHCCRV